MQKLEEKPQRSDSWRRLKNRPHGLAEPMWTDPGIKSGISVRELISTLKKKEKKRRRGMNCRTCSQNPRKRLKTTTTNYFR